MSQVIGIVVGNQQSFSQDRLSGAVGNRGVEIGGGIYYQIRHGLKILLEGSKTLVPGAFIRGFRTFRPVALGKLGRYMYG